MIAITNWIIAITLEYLKIHKRTGTAPITALICLVTQLIDRVNGVAVIALHLNKKGRERN